MEQLLVSLKDNAIPAMLVLLLANLIVVVFTNIESRIRDRCILAQIGDDPHIPDFATGGIVDQAKLSPVDSTTLRRTNSAGPASKALRPGDLDRIAEPLAKEGESNRQSVDHVVQDGANATVDFSLQDHRAKGPELSALISILSLSKETEGFFRDLEGLRAKQLAGLPTNYAETIRLGMQRITDNTLIKGQHPLVKLEDATLPNVLKSYHKLYDEFGDNSIKTLLYRISADNLPTAIAMYQPAYLLAVIIGYTNELQREKM